ncbi:hypothetical protein J2W49_003988 [Hydrogenophaga palleronii]|uniref:Uncharacterized protein n=1 Tax=Hydrogenophaga palleronii TaxID=65655 RepID=A0ABU1WSX5_9BURK|nr:hypothetical protein [Hydrogenophaga palleronii]MDR7152012.1 hypothetical protein [Hydrogenophaga palleronii]
MSIKIQAQKYKECMKEAKRRIEVVDQLISRKITTGILITDVELMCVQIRKILELIALSSLAANQVEYQKISNSLAKLWNAKEIVKNLEPINPKYYPEPIVLQGWNDDPNHTRTQPVKSGYLTRDELLDIYSRCGGLLHAQNPFGRSKDFVQACKVIPVWLKKIKSLLDKHIVNLVDSETMIMVILNLGFENDVSVGVYWKSSA